MNNEVKHISEHFDWSTFDGLTVEDMGSKFWNGTIGVFISDDIITIEKIFMIANSGKKVTRKDMSKI